ncbi:MAG: RnfABCDGE type electron transport complex subunit D [Oscillospiraceae bacterium]|jgi:electron transport complex protein RnfD|nr:RnfABCDGE type electron transport complex subunit D [Oscillospiraceae bacterium]
MSAEEEKTLTPASGQQLAIVSATPHLRTHRTTQAIMLDVCLALIPAVAASVWCFGTRALIVMLFAVISCVAFEAITRIALKRAQTVQDLSAVVTGLLLGMNLPPTLPLWMIPIGSFAAIVVVKQLFGGIGQNFANPAITARIVLMLSFPTQMTSWNAANGHAWGADAASAATPMKALTANELGAFSGDDLPSILDMFVGRHGGSLGETCAVALLLGAIYLCVFRVITPLIPCFYIGTVAVITFIAGGFDAQFTIYHLLGGGLILGACFMATDYATSPVNWKGKIVFAIGCGILTSLIRLFGSMPEGVSFSILLMNLLVPHIENLTAPRTFGKERKRHAK